MRGDTRNPGDFPQRGKVLFRYGERPPRELLFYTKYPPKPV